MSTSDTKITHNKMLKTAFIYLLVSLFCAFFGAIYELFSHEVYSYFMIYAFAFPLVGGTLTFFILGFYFTKKLPKPFSLSLYHCGISTLTVGSIIKGVLDIYGTTNHLANYYWIVGFVLLFAGIISFLISGSSKEHLSNPHNDTLDYKKQDDR